MIIISICIFSFCSKYQRQPRATNNWSNRAFRSCPSFSSDSMATRQNWPPWWTSAIRRGPLSSSCCSRSSRWDWLRTPISGATICFCARLLNRIVTQIVSFLTGRWSRTAGRPTTLRYWSSRRCRRRCVVSQRDICWIYITRQCAKTWIRLASIWKRTWDTRGRKWLMNIGESCVHSFCQHGIYILFANRKSQLLAFLLCIGSVDIALGNQEAEQRFLDVLHDLFQEGILDVAHITDWANGLNCATHTLWLASSWCCKLPFTHKYVYKAIIATKTIQL